MMRTLTILLFAVSGVVVSYRTDAPVQSFNVEVPVPPTPVPVNGVPRLVYELHLTNRADEPLALRRIVAYDAVSGRPLLDLAREALAARIARLGEPGAAGDPSVPPLGRAVVYIELDMPAAAADPGRALEHEIGFARAQGTETIRLGPVMLGTTLPTLGPPVRGGPWVAVYDASWPRGHRRVLYEVDGRQRIPGRFAIDWIQVDTTGRTTRGDADLVANWLGYGQDVLAVADAVVVSARDDVAESARISSHPDHPLADATGNYIALALGGGRFAFYEHLKPGSVRVSVGDSVRRGDAIAALGFTGHSTAPHLHFHVADASSPRGAEGVPFALDCFELRGAYEDIASLGVTAWRPRAPGKPVRRLRERPPPNAVVEFGCPTVRR